MKTLFLVQIDKKKITDLNRSFMYYRLPDVAATKRKESNRKQQVDLMAGKLGHHCCNSSHRILPSIPKRSKQIIILNFKYEIDFSNMICDFMKTKTIPSVVNSAESACYKV